MRAIDKIIFNMKNAKWKIAYLPIKDLSLWDENARFPSDYFKKKEIVPIALLMIFLSGIGLES